MSLPGPFELIIIFMVIFLFFGARRFPEIARGLGEGIQEFKKTLADMRKTTD